MVRFALCVCGKNAISCVSLSGIRMSVVIVCAGSIWEEVLMRLRRMGVFAGWMAGMVLTIGLARMAGAQADYPFRDTKLGDDQRIADLLGRLTLD